MWRIPACICLHIINFTSLTDFFGNLFGTLNALANLDFVLVHHSIKISLSLKDLFSFYGLPTRRKICQNASIIQVQSSSFFIYVFFLHGGFRSFQSLFNSYVIRLSKYCKHGRWILARFQRRGSYTFSLFLLPGSRPGSSSGKPRHLRRPLQGSQHHIYHLFGSILPLLRQ
ncbi:hypothetical protein T4D_7334 [Trichinella pseudospiralis]|uniref:Uncharacterized protein n=1 Tax=Trichinella pseudospiralis TaxID=6337 RepID=A0A0V1G6M5_TRIPS|nr:hypothetical protein T4D_7334 [Trichinella pseudospiralis]